MARSPEEEHPQKAFGWAARDNSGTLSPFNFSRRDNGEDDVTIKILYCGVCHSDLHSAKNDWGFTSYPVVPGLGLGCWWTPARNVIAAIRAWRIIALR
ncbi:hypothetical protein LWI28_006680 [Acer negundo]|uniref:Alcohol dehydrogenase-like N-terminal domain-containing protein n=1 Tax=Acer negundo TaxID=4023 RepID=A0AAD5IIM4_ACENE|nr:hypothetical protein LWI28_006680 [Acer negundo]